MKYFVLLFLLSACSGLPSILNPLSGGGGPTVNSNAQIGKENRQSVLSLEQAEEIYAGRDVVKTEVIKEVETESVENLDITNTNISPWMILLMLLGWLLPTPTQIGQSIANFFLALFKRKM